MKKDIILFFAAIALAGCAKDAETVQNALDKEFFEEWIKMNYPKAQKTALGSYIINREDGGGKAVGTSEENSFIRADYIIRGLNGTYSACTGEHLAKQLDDWMVNGYFGARILNRAGNNMYAGIEEAIQDLKVGGSVTVAIPGWLQTKKRYSSAEEYYKKVNDNNAPQIFHFDIKEAFSDMEKWQKDSIKRYLSHNFPSVHPTDTGFYLITVKESDKPDTTYTDEDKIYIRYTGMLLNGTVFDTNIKEVAWNCGNPDMRSSYNPDYITWKENANDIKMGTSETSVISGFAAAVHQLKPHQKVTAIFWSGLGYGASASGTSAKGYFSTIPEYSPLRFDIEAVDKPE